MNGKPDWKDAPEWAKFLAMDSDNEWFWFENKPVLGARAWFEWKGKFELISLEIPSENPFWRQTLEERPQ